MAVIQKLSIHQFRNLTQQYLTPSENINLFIGNNAQGKTNLIEAIYYLGHNRSFKTKSIQELIQFNSAQFQLDAQTDKNRIKLKKSNNKQQLSINQKNIKNSSQLSQILPIQIITPDKGFIVNGTPKNKRSYLDWGVFHVKPNSVKSFKTYNKVLKNLNTLLAKNQTNEIDFWLLALAKSAVEINQNRKDYLQQLKKTTKDQQNHLLSNLIGADGFDYEFHSGWPKEVDNTNEQNIYQHLQKNKNNLTRIKHLNYGSHKANIHFSHQQKNECFLSRGQQKSLSIVFWLSQVLLLSDMGIKPVILIDDISSELEDKKINFILNQLKNLKVQTFITDIRHNPAVMSDINADIYQIERGLIVLKK